MKPDQTQSDHIRHKLLTGAAIVALGIAAGQGALAQSGGGFSIEEITVTATKMGATNIQDTPIAMTAYTSDYLDRSGAKDLRDLALTTPNLTMAQNGAFSQLYIRGIGSNNVFAGADPSSTLHVDGVYMARPASVFSNFIDVERVEVLRGPQGTLYGRNSVGGTVNVISRKPDNEFRAKAQLTVGNYDLWRGEGYVSGPIIEDKLAASFSAMRSKHDGYFENVVASGNDRGSEDAWGGRFQLRATPNEKLEVLIRADYMEDKGDFVGNQALLVPFFPVANGPENPVTGAIRGDWHKVALDAPSETDRHLWGVSGEVRYEFSEAATLTSLTAYRESKLEYASDTDASNLPRQITTQFEDQNQFSQEFNLSGQIDRLNYILGLYYFEEEIVTDSHVFAFPAGFATNPSPSVDTKAWAVYGQANYAVTEQVTLTAGLRYTDEKKEFDQTLNRYSLTTGLPLAGFPVNYLNEGDYTAWTPKFGIEFRPTDVLMLYASATRGFKSGGFNFSSGNAAQGYDPETLWSYEVGFKSDLLDNRLRLNGSAFYYDYKDLQVQSFITPGVVDITNAATAEVKGVELELLARPVMGLDLGGSLTWLDATYDDFPAATVPGGVIDASGNRLNSSPKWAYTAFAQYNIDLGNNGGMFVRGEYGWKARQFFTVANDDIQTMGSYDLINASIGYNSPDGRWQAVLYGRNLSDTQYLVSTGSFTAVPSGTPGDPRTYGLRLSFTY